MEFDFEKEKHITSCWFRKLRDNICTDFLQLEIDFIKDSKSIPINKNLNIGFKRKKWNRDEGGGGEMSIMKGNIFEKVGVNISTVYGVVPKEIKFKNGKSSNNFWASGISVVGHMNSPIIPAIHMNTRFICIDDEFWFGGGIDITPTYEDLDIYTIFHSSLEKMCDKHNRNYYNNFKKECDKYFYIKHREEPRGIGGIFYDYHNSKIFNKDFDFNCDVGLEFLNISKNLIRNYMHKEWSQKEKEEQLYKRGKYIEFNLLYDRGTRFGLLSGGNIDAIFMSLPPIAKWN